MAMNRIQFQHGMSLPEFLRGFGTEAACAQAVMAVRWPNGFDCPKCGEEAHCDDVTGLPNRGLFAELATPALQRSRRSGVGCVVLHIEVDRLDGVNDIYGRSQGDLVLAGIAQRLRSCIRSGDLAAVNPMAEESSVVARLGDSAFSVLIADLDGQERASAVAQRLLEAVAQPITVDGLPMLLSASIERRLDKAAVATCCVLERRPPASPRGRPLWARA